LACVVSYLTKKWSMDLLTRAGQGDVDAMLTVGQLLFAPNGYGIIPFAPHEGIVWFNRAFLAGAPHEASLLKRYFTKIYFLSETYRER